MKPPHMDDAELYNRLRAMVTASKAMVLYDENFAAFQMERLLKATPRPQAIIGYDPVTNAFTITVPYPLQYIRFDHHIK